MMMSFSGTASFTPLVSQLLGDSKTANPQNEGTHSRRRLRHSVAAAHLLQAKALGGILQPSHPRASDRCPGRGLLRGERFDETRASGGKDGTSLCCTRVQSLQVGVNEVVLAVSYRPEDMAQALKAMEEKYKIKLTVSLEEEPMGTGMRRSEHAQSMRCPAVGVASISNLRCVLRLPFFLQPVLLLWLELICPTARCFSCSTAMLPASTR
jgi:hypothetical protein